MNVVVVGSRDRKDSEKDKETVEELVQQLVKQHGTRLHIVSVGCDKGVGRYVRDYCMAKDIIFVESRMKLEGKAGAIPRSFFIQVFQARNPSLLELGDEFFIFKGPYDSGIVEALAPQAVKKVGLTRVKTYEWEDV
jgi:hypothetical protein